MNDLINIFLLTGNMFMPETHLRRPGFTDIACGQFTKNKERIQKFKESRHFRNIYQNELDKACFQPGISHGDFKVLS